MHTLTFDAAFSADRSDRRMATVFMIFKYFSCRLWLNDLKLKQLEHNRISGLVCYLQRQSHELSKILIALPRAAWNACWFLSARFNQNRKNLFSVSVWIRYFQWVAWWISFWMQLRNCAPDWQVSTVKIEQLDWNAIILWVEKERLLQKSNLHEKRLCAWGPFMNFQPCSLQVCNTQHDLIATRLNVRTCAIAKLNLGAMKQLTLFTAT